MTKPKLTSVLIIFFFLMLVALLALLVVQLSRDEGPARITKVWLEPADSERTTLRWTSQGLSKSDPVYFSLLCWREKGPVGGTSGYASAWWLNTTNTGALNWTPMPDGCELLVDSDPAIFPESPSYNRWGSNLTQRLSKYALYNATP